MGFLIKNTLYWNIECFLIVEVLVFVLFRGEPYGAIVHNT